VEHDCKWGLTAKDVEALRIMSVEHTRVMHVLFADNGDKGLVTQIRGFLTRADERARILEEAEQRREKADKHRTRWLMVWLSAMTLSIIVSQLLPTIRLVIKHWIA